MRPAAPTASVAVIATVLAVAATTSAQHAPLSDAERAIVDGVPSEEVPEPEEHYWVSNEWRHDLFFDAIRDRGGAFVGVGTDQCYTLAAVQDASIVWIADYDPAVRDVHRMYGVLVRASETAAALRARFDPAHAAETIALLEQAVADDVERRAIVRLYRRNRRRFEGYLRHVAILAEDGAPTSWLSDPALYARVRALFVADRVVARTADVTGATTLRAIADASRRLGAPVRVLYLSNAEAFFGYGAELQANVRALPIDAVSVVLRTFRHDGAPYPRGDTWHYLVEPTRDLVERFDLGYRRSAQIVGDAVASGLDARGVTTIGPGTRRRDLR